MMGGRESTYGKNDSENDKNDWENTLNSQIMYACSQLDTCHVRKYMGSTW
jgi:hypothetical protein